MRFYDYETTRDLVKKSPFSPGITAQEFYREQFLVALGQWRSKACAVQAMCEGLWEENRRPYYNVYPAIAPMLTRLNLDVDTSLIKPPMPVFLIRFPQEKPPLCWDDGWHVRSILVGPTTLGKVRKVFDGFVLWVDTGERDIAPHGQPFPVHTYINLPICKGMSLEQSIHALPYDLSAYKGMMMPKEMRIACARLACTICLLGNDPELIEPDVLAKDRHKELTQTIIERAHRRGKLGWNIGKGIEVIPHVRRPHPALMWTQKGRTMPKIVMRKGSVVHREKVTRIPSGFAGLEEAQDE